VLPEVAAATGVSPQCEVLCGVHDSNAALLAARGYPAIADREATVLSTGTWFVAMRSLDRGAKLESIELDESRDCLVNVDVYGHAIPSARFMGGREAELIGKLGAFDIRAEYDSDTALHRLHELVAKRAFVYPALVPGVGPFPNAKGGWERQPSDADGQRAIASLYLALVADASLQLIGSRGRLLIDGRYAEDQVFVRALATLRPEQKALVAAAQHDVAYGALRLIDPALPPQHEAKSVEPLDVDLDSYAAEWRARACQSLNKAATGQ
jgi:sugar (pentulose or hexulose) kinase